MKIFNATGAEELKRAAKPITPTNNQAAVLRGQIIGWAGPKDQNKMSEEKFTNKSQIGWKDNGSEQSVGMGAKLISKDFSPVSLKSFLPSL